MKKSIRIIGGMLAVTTTLMTLASCKASPSGKDDDDTFGGNGGKTVVRYYSFNDEQSNKELKAAIEADFYKKNPDIKIQLEISTGNFYSNLLNDISGKNATPFIAICVFWYKMEVKMMSGVTVGTIVDLLRMECLVKSLCYMVDIFHVSSAFFGSQLYNLTDVFLMGNDHTSFMALFFK